VRYLAIVAGIALAGVIIFPLLFMNHADSHTFEVAIIAYGSTSFGFFMGFRTGKDSW